MLHRKLVPVFLALASACVSSACFAETGVTGKEILIGTSHALTGQSATAGIETDIGINSYINEVNAKGGVNGRKIRVITCDDKYEPDSAIACFQSLTQQGVFAIAGVYGSVTSARYVPMSMNNKVPLVGFYNGTLFLTDPVKKYVFSTRCSYRDESLAAVEHLWKEGFRKFAIIYQNDAFGADWLEGVKVALKAHNAELAGAASYTRNKMDVSEAVNQVKKASPEVVFLGAVYKPSAEIIKLAKETGWHPVFVMNTGSSVDLLIPEVGQAAEGDLYTEAAPVPTQTEFPMVKEYLKALKKSYPNEKPCYTSLRGYFDAAALVEGLKRAGKDLTRETFVTAMESIHNLNVGLGKGMELSYSPTDHMGFHKVYFGTIKDKEAVPFTNWHSLDARR